MRISEIPNEAFTAQPTPVPQKIMYDWDALYAIVQDKGFIIIESDVVRVLPSGAEESVLVKAFNSHLRQTKSIGLRTKRISKTRWYCTL